MSFEVTAELAAAADRAVAAARAAFRSGKCKPAARAYRLRETDGPYCCLVGAACVDAPEYVWFPDYANREYGLTDDLRFGLQCGWDDGVEHPDHVSPPLSTEFGHGYEKGRALALELVHNRAA